MTDPQIILYQSIGEHQIPHRATEGAAGWDVCAAEAATLLPFQTAVLATNFNIAIPDGHALLLLPRSGFSIKNQVIVPNSVGVIDEDFRGHMRLALTWMPDPVSVMEIVFRAAPFPQSQLALQYRPDATFHIEKDSRIAQALLIPYKEQEWRQADELPTTKRGSGGLGHTGLRAQNPSRQSDGQEKLQGP